jgi:deazaflavin-dependent oxidoreductase (nitroreductase family)
VIEGEYIPSPAEWVRKQVELYESSGGTAGTDLRGLPVVLVTHRGRQTGAVRKTPLMRVAVENGAYVLVGSKGGAPEHPKWVHNLRAHPEVEVRDGPSVRSMRVREVEGDERAPLWEAAVAAFPQYADYEQKTSRLIPLFLAEPV